MKFLVGVWAVLSAGILFGVERYPYVWAKESNAISLKGESSQAFTFRHTGAKNWCVNITERLPVKPGDRYALACATESVGAKERFTMNVCLFAADGTAVDWSFSPVTLKPGRRVTTTFTVPKGVARLYVRFRGDGPAAAKVTAFSLTKLANVSLAGFDGDPGMTETLKGKGGFFLRDVAKGGVYLPVSEMKDFALDVKETDGAFDVMLKELSGQDRAVSLVYAVPLAAGPITWHETLRKSETFTSGERQYTVSQGTAGRGRIARWPFAAVTVGGEGLALGVDPEAPAFFRSGANAETRQLYLVFDFGFAPEHPTAHVRFRRFAFDGNFGLRGALVEYRRLYPEMFRVRCAKHGLWTVMDTLKKLPGLDDFGFRFRGRMGETAFDDEHDYMTFRYTEPTTWWASVPKEMRGEKGYTFEDGVAICEKLAAQPLPPPKGPFSRVTPGRHAQGWKTSVILDEDGERVGRKCRQSWCEGILWALNSAPGIGGPGAMNDFRAKISPETFDERYPEPFPKGLDGEYYDSAEIFMTPCCDFARAHFAGMETPLVFDRDSLRPAVWKGMIAYEYVREASRLAHGKGRLTLANCTPIKWWFLVPFLDVPGSEVWWLKERSEGSVAWQPMDDEDFMFRRSMCGGKPLCLLQDAPFDHFTKEMTEKYFQRSLAYGALPSFFTWHGVSTFGHNIYFKRPDCYERDRPLFKKYVPICKALSEAGWQPVNGVTESRSEGVITEQFGERGQVYATVFNLTDKSVQAKIRVKVAGEAFAELVTGASIAVTNGVLTLSLPPETVRALALAK